MTTAPPALKASTFPGSGAGERRHRRRERRRLVRQQIAVVVVMVLALVITLLVLGQQWLHGAGSLNTGAGPLRAVSPAPPFTHAQEAS
jgi:ferric-dicitrate binding protein FerR (iron transport regulator)